MRCSIAILFTLLFFVLSIHAGGQPGGVGGGPGYGKADSGYSRVQSDYKMVWRGIEMTTASLLKTIGATNSEAALLLRQTQTNALFLEAKWDAWYRGQIKRQQFPGDDYFASLRGDNHVLTDLKKEKDGKKAVETLRDVALDLQIKADNCRHSKDGLGKEIKVRVHTKDGEKEVGGYEVYFVAKGMLSVKSAHDRFPRQSSPTDEKILPPGRYAMWVRKKGVASEPITLGIGGRGETRLEVDIPVASE